MTHQGGKHRQIARRPQRREEQALHQQVAAFLEMAAPNLVWFHCPNGGGRSKAEAGILKSMGVKAGVADFAFVLPTGKAAFLELKAKGGRLSPAQGEFRDQVVAAGAWWAEARTLEDVQTVLLGWDLALRCRLAGVSR